MTEAPKKTHEMGTLGNPSSISVAELKHIKIIQNKQQKNTNISRSINW
jgi:hypothetical protein